MQKMPVSRKKKITAREARSRFAKVTIQKPSRAARQAADKLAAILEEHLDRLPAAERSAKLKAFHESVSDSLATRAKRARRLKNEAPVSLRVAAQR